MKTTIKNLVAGVDIGGSHIAAALIDTNTGEILEHTRRRLKVDPVGSSDHIIGQWASVIADCYIAGDSLPYRIGIAMPGPFDYKQGVSYIKGQSKFDSLYGINIRQRLAEQLNIEATGIVFSNDAESYLKGEMLHGAGKGFTRTIGLTIGTGLGSAISLDGKTRDAELWCSAFHGSMAEDHLSSRWFINRYRQLTGGMVENVQQLLHHSAIQPAVQEIMTELGVNLAEFLAKHIRDNKLQLVVLGGNISRAFDRFSDPLITTLSTENIEVEIRTSVLWEDAALLGSIESHLIRENFEI